VCAPTELAAARLPRTRRSRRDRHQAKFDEWRGAGLCDWMRPSMRVAVTDTTMRERTVDAGDATAHRRHDGDRPHTTRAAAEKLFR